VHIRADLAAAGPTVAKLEREIGAYSRSLSAKRLMARGVAPAVAAPIVVDTQSTNRVSRMASALGSVFILYLVMAPFVLVFAMAADTSAGERERRSLEPLLTHPLRAAEIVVGKFVALASVNLASMALCIALSLGLLGRSPTAELGLRMDTGFAAGLTVFLWLAPLCMLVAAVQLALGFASKTFKEAQQTSMMVSFLPLVVGMLLLMRPGLTASLWPLAWEIKALAGPLLGSTSAVAPFPVVAAIELVLVVLALLAAALRLRSERVLG
jgi:sodium transport system permease protein